MIPDPKGYYAQLEVHPSASPAVIRAAYRARAMQLHPDRNDSLSSTVDFQRLQEAFEVLGDPVRKSAYDDWALQMMTAPPRPRASPPQPLPPPRRSGSRLAVPAGVVTVGVLFLGGWLYFSSEQAYSDTPRVAPSAARPATAPDAGMEMLTRIQRLPTSGILQLDLPSEAFAPSDRLPRLKLVAPRDASYLVKLTTWDNDGPAMSVFVRAGESTEVLVPPGRYHIRLASGVEWYGEQFRFGPNTQYAQVDTLSDFQALDSRLLRHELQLGEATGSSARPIAASSF